MLSDLHLEFLSSIQVESMIDKVVCHGADVLVLAEDIGNPRDRSYADFMRRVSTHFPKVFVIAGNHEFYGGSVGKTEECISQICSEIDNVSYLSNHAEEYNGFYWIGTTLWYSITDPR